MPSKSAAQARLMAAVAHGWHKPGGGGPPMAVAQEFNQADKGTGILEGIAAGAGGRKRKVSGALAGVIHRAKMARGA